MDFYGIVFIYVILKYYSNLLSIKFNSFSIEVKTEKGTKFNVIQWDDIENYIDDLLKGYNLQYQKLLRERIVELKGYVNDMAESLIAQTNPFDPYKGFYNLWLGEKYTLKELPIIQPLPYVSINYIERITGCSAVMKSSVDNYEYNITAYSDNPIYNNYSDAKYKYILSRLANEKVTTLTYNQLAKNECPQEISAIFKKINKMLDELKLSKKHEDVNGITLDKFLIEFSKYADNKNSFLTSWQQVYEPFDISKRADYAKLDPILDADNIISKSYM